MSIRHVSPTNDSQPHDTENGGQCACSPKVEFLKNGDTVVIHNAWDGREIFEELDAAAPKAAEGGAAKCPECGKPGHPVVAVPMQYVVWACEESSHAQWKTKNNDGGRHG